MTCADLAHAAGEAALKEARDFDAHSKLGDSCCGDREVLDLQWTDLKVGNLLGYGSFSSVTEVDVPQLRQKQQERSNETRQRYAVKTLREEKMSEAFDIGAIDLVLEAKILKNLNHENIIKLHGIGGEGLLDSQGQITGFFLVLERLYGTLDQSLWKWRNFVQKQKKSYGGLSLQKYRHDPEMLYRRKTIALAIARGLEYLHENHVVHRDVKPHNIGFDVDGGVRIFDFGLARDLDPHDQSVTYRGGRCLTGTVGTPRYMAPENALCEPYGLPSDVYSFAVLLWEILTLKIAYDNVAVDAVADRIARGNERPPLRRTGGTISTSLKSLLERSWDASPSERPNMKVVYGVLEADLKSSSPLDEQPPGQSNNEDTSLSCQKGRKRRKSRFSSLLKAQS